MPCSGGVSKTHQKWRGRVRGGSRCGWLVTGPSVHVLKDMQLGHDAM